MGNALDHAEKYSASIAALGLEVQTFWTINQTFLLGETILAGFLLQAGAPRDVIHQAGALLGVLSGLLWVIALSRSSDYHKLRALQARQLEMDAPDGVMTQGEKFREDGSITLAGTAHTASLLGRIPIRVAGLGLAWGFFAFFGLVFLASL